MEQRPTARVVGRPFPKGVSGNPSGRPATKIVTARLRELLKRPDLDVMLGQVIAQAKKGDLPSLNFIADRLDGRPLQQLEHSGDMGADRVILVRQDVNVNGHRDPD